MAVKVINPIMSLIKLEGEKVVDSCRYCDDKKSLKRTWNLSSDCLTVEDYKLLMDAGWRRHGNQVYKTMNKENCCPAYTIRCDTENFRISKGQKKVLSVVAQFLSKGEMPLTVEKQQRNSGDGMIGQSESIIPSSMLDECRKATLKRATSSKSEDSGWSEREVGKAVFGRSGSSKRKRWEALQARMKSHAEKRGVSYEEIMKSYLERRKKRLEKNKPKDIEEYLALEKSNSTPAHFFEIRLIKNAPKSDEFKATYDTEYSLFHKYQVSIHKTDPDSITPESFDEYLVNSNLVNVHDAQAEAAGAPQFGSYHQQYWLDGKKLIAVGVVDLVPGCLSSVYFFYDPDYSFLHLGTYSALREIAFIRHLQKTYGPIVPMYANFSQFYLGYYIHSTPKMNYKADFAPSFLVCPETNEWVPVEKCRRLLDRSKYIRFADDCVKKKSTSKPIGETKIRLHLTEALLKALSNEDFKIEGDEIITTLNAVEGVMPPEELQLIRQWVSLFENTGTMCIVSRNRSPRFDYVAQL